MFDERRLIALSQRLALVVLGILLPHQIGLVLLSAHQAGDVLLLILHTEPSLLLTHGGHQAPFPGHLLHHLFLAHHLAQQLVHARLLIALHLVEDLAPAERQRQLPLASLTHVLLVLPGLLGALGGKLRLSLRKLPACLVREPLHGLLRALYPRLGRRHLLGYETIPLCLLRLKPQLALALALVGGGRAFEDSALRILEQEPRRALPLRHLLLLLLLPQPRFFLIALGLDRTEAGRERCGEHLHARQVISGNQRTWIAARRARSRSRARSSERFLS